MKKRKVIERLVCKKNILVSTARRSPARTTALARNCVLCFTPGPAFYTGNCQMSVYIPEPRRKFISLETSDTKLCGVENRNPEKIGVCIPLELIIFFNLSKFLEENPFYGRIRQQDSSYWRLNYRDRKTDRSENRSIGDGNVNKSSWNKEVRVFEKFPPPHTRYPLVS